MVRLFNPRKDRWNRHLMWDGPILVGRTHTGRVTIDLLEINRAEAVDLREFLILEGSFPPEQTTHWRCLYYGVASNHQQAGLGTVTMVSADQDLNITAMAEALAVDDPFAHP